MTEPQVNSGTTEHGLIRLHTKRPFGRSSQETPEGGMLEVQ